jgi:pimeloyl-ACP methyl ester carboxylesterase
MTGPVFLYLHGFASHAGSTKGRAFSKWGDDRGLDVERLDLRVPSFEHLRLSAMKARVREAIGPDPRARAVLIGSSLGALTALRVAEEDPRVCSVFCLAPAFRLADRWKSRLGDAGWERWRSEGSLEVDDYLTGGKSRVDFGFADELDRLDEGWPDVRVPVRIVHGLRDSVVPIELSRTWSAGKRHVKLVEVDDTHELVASIPLILQEAAEHLGWFL